MQLTVTSQHIGDNGSKSKTHAMPNSDVDGRKALCGRTVKWTNGNLYGTEHEITCLPCVKVMRKAEATANTDKFIAESDARMAAMEINADHTEALAMENAWNSGRLYTGENDDAMEDAAVIVRTHKVDMIENVLVTYRTGSFEPQAGLYVGDGVSFLTGTTKGAQPTLTRRTGEVMERVNTPAGTTGSILFHSYIIREYGTNEVFEINSGRVRMLHYGTWESTEQTAIDSMECTQTCSTCKAVKTIEGPWNTTVVYCRDYCIPRIHA